MGPVPRNGLLAVQLPDDPLLGFIEIPAAPFTMGSSSEPTLAPDNERPQHTVTLPAYFIGTYQVTVEQFTAFVQDAGRLGPPPARRRWRGPVAGEPAE